MGALFFPLLRSNFQKKIAPEQIYVEADGEKVNLTQMLSRKVNIYQGNVNKNKILITDGNGNVTVVTGVVMQQSERDQLKKLNPGTAIDLDGNKINVRIDPTTLAIDNDNRLTVVDPSTTSHTHEIKDVNQLRQELDDRILIYQPNYPGKMLVVDQQTKNITFADIPDGVDVTQYQMTGVHIATINDTKIYAPDYQFTAQQHDNIVTHEERIKTLESKVNAFFDIDVRSWTEFLQAVQVSLQFSVRIHFRNHITVGTSPTLNLSNCIINGHYFKWIVNGHTPTLSGNFAYFDNVWIQGASNGSASSPMFQWVGSVVSMPDGSTSGSCSLYFENCRIYNFLETGNGVFIRTAEGSGVSVHTIMHNCTVNGESTQTSSRTLLLQRAGSLCASLKIFDLIYSGKTRDCNRVAMSGTFRAQDMFVSDGSCEYPSGFSRPSNFHQWGTVSITRNLVSGTPIAAINGTQLYAPSPDSISYTIETVSTTEGFLKSYQLVKTDASGNKTYLPGKIDITKDLFLNTVERVTVSAQNPVQQGGDYLQHGDYFRFDFNTDNGIRSQYVPIDLLRAEMTAGSHITINGTEISATGFVPQYADLSNALPSENIVFYTGPAENGLQTYCFYERDGNSWQQRDVQPQRTVAHTHPLSEVYDGDLSLATATELDITTLAASTASGQPLPPDFNIQLTYATNEDIINIFPNLSEYTDNNDAVAASDNDIDGVFGN